MEETKKRELENRLKEMLQNEIPAQKEPSVVQTRGTSGNVIRRRKGEQEKRIATLN